MDLACLQVDPEYRWWPVKTGYEVRCNYRKFLEPLDIIIGRYHSPVVGRIPIIEL
jgi:hypothetical protein